MSEQRPTASSSDDLPGELSALLNRYCAENVSGTPDFILAEFLLDTLKAFNGAAVKRAGWRDEPVGLWDYSSKRGNDMITFEGAQDSVYTTAGTDPKTAALHILQAVEREDDGTHYVLLAAKTLRNIAPGLVDVPSPLLSGRQGDLWKALEHMSGVAARGGSYTDAYLELHQWWIDHQPPLKEKWRAMVDEVELIDGEPYGLAFVLSELAHLAERPGSVRCLALIIAVCERRLEGKKLVSIPPGAANPAAFSVWGLLRSFTSDPEEPDDYSWHTLGRNAAGWLDKILTEQL